MFLGGEGDGFYGELSCGFGGKGGVAWRSTSMD